MSLIAPGVCRHCKCTDQDVDGDKRRWLNDTRTCCSYFACVRAEQLRIKQAKEQSANAIKQPTRPTRKYGDKYKNWGYGAILEDRRRQQRRKQRGKGKAA